MKRGGAPPFDPDRKLGQRDAYENRFYFSGFHSMPRFLQKARTCFCASGVRAVQFEMKPGQICLTFLNPERSTLVKPLHLARKLSEMLWTPPKDERSTPVKPLHP